MQRVLSLTRRAIEQYNMISDGDKVAVGVSGGKDSLTLLCALAKLSVFYPKKFSVIGIAVDLFNGQTDYSKIESFCKEMNVEFTVVKSNIYDVVFEDRKEKNPCSLCSKMRRGILNTKALELGCNKIALGHHADDIMETMFLSLFYEGRLSTFHPVSYMSNTKLTVIRPLVLTSERLISNVSKDFPILHNCCPANHITKREYVKNLIKSIEKDIPFVKDRILSAITETERYNMLDKLDDIPQNINNDIKK